MRALVTGGCGFIGSHLAEALLARGDRVTVVDDLSTGRLDNVAHLVGRPDFRVAIETITDEAAMDRLVSACDIIYHLAAAVGVELIVSDPVRVIETNIVGSGAVLRVVGPSRRSASSRKGTCSLLPYTSEVEASTTFLR